jgi:ABC-type Mn2+/Zn2+ transport system ATPase subunit
VDIVLKKCNSIENGQIKIIDKSLNIKYGINGTGKSTISKAIEYYVIDKNNSSNELSKLKPFKYRDNTNENNPEVSGLDLIENVAIFNEDYINQYVFQPNEVLKNSFDILINNETYQNGMAEINELIKDISKTFEDNKDIEIMLDNLNELLKSFGTANGLSKSSSFSKAFKNGNLVENIPNNLLVYKDFIEADNNTKWLNWQMTGKDYLDISSCCPYCTSSDIEEKKETIKAVSENYDSKLIEHLNKIIKTISKLKEYFTVDSYDKIIEISKSVNGLQKEEESFILEIREQIKTLIEKLQNVRRLGFQSLKDFDKVDETIKTYKIKLSYMAHLNTDVTEEKILKINTSLDEILEKSSQLQGKVNIQKKQVKDTIEKHKKDINTFLKYAGYSYSINIEEDSANNSYKMQLIHNDFVESNIDNTKNHLSFGEKNAFALILFMYEVLKNNPDLIILDDPISSFDKNKKFAILEMLFANSEVKKKQRNNFSNKTVLMLTHDFEPIVDIIYVNPKGMFDKINPTANYLENIEGVLSEKDIIKNDIKTFIDIAEENILLLDEQINKLIYLRRLCEITNNKGFAYQLLSNLFHKREVPIYKSLEDDRAMTEDEIEEATEEIKNKIKEEFCYSSCYQNIIDNDEIKRLYSKSSNNYEKLQIYRILFNENNENRVIRKFVNETFHIENDYIYQLNPFKYQTIPHYIIKECDIDIEQNS